MDDEVFKALNDPSRRLLLDRLFDEDGQTLGELTAHLPQMTRFGVMNHLSVLEAAGLVTTRKVGRSKHHYLNPVPIRLVHDRWISKYTEPVVGAMASMKTQLEGGTRTMSEPTHIYQTYIKCEPEQAWNAIVDGDLTVNYFYGTRVESDWEPGAAISYTYPDGSTAADGEVIAIDHGRRVEMTFLARWDPELEAEGPAHMAWIVETDAGLTRVTVEYYDLDPSSKRLQDFAVGLPYIVGGMKTLLETGKPIGS
jgi:DNA-binding transcriptional ArsR family regulator/uncharacterized protein YndB with AHSA1/START domain